MSDVKCQMLLAADLCLRRATITCFTLAAYQPGSLPGIYDI